MKRVLGFLLLIATGLLVLQWLEEDPEVEPPEPGPRPTTERPSEDPDRQPQQGIDIAVGGEFRGVYYDKDSGRAMLSWSGEDSRTVDGVDEGVNVFLELLDPKAETKVVQVELRAALSRSKRKADEQGMFGWIPEPRIELEEASIQVESGAPFVPLQLEVPSATVNVLDPNARVITSPDRVELYSPQLEAQGEGLSLDLDGGILTLERRAEIEFSGEPGARSKLTSNGRLILMREMQAEEPRLAIIARGGAVLELPGVPPARLEARTIMLRGQEPASGAAGFAIAGIRAEGDVVWRSANNVFRSERGRVEFDEQGEPLTASLEGLPSFRISLAEEAAEIPGIPARELSTIRGSGEGPLVLGLQGEARRMELKGPATLETPAGTLRAAGAIDGDMQGEGSEQKITFRAIGGVVLEGGDATLETAELAVELHGGATPERSIHAEASQGARLIGKLEDGREFALTTPDRLVVVQVGEHWRVAEAMSVLLSLEGPDGFTARADEVRDFDPQTQSFAALGNVSFENENGRAAGETIAVRSPIHFVLLGSDQERAFVEGAEGRIDAGRLERAGSLLRARDGATATLYPSRADDRAERYELSSRALEIERDESSGDLHVLAQGQVSASMFRAGETNTLSAQRLEGHHIESIDAKGSVLHATSSFVAEGEVQGTLALERGTLEVSSQRLELDRSEGLEAEPSHRVEAQGEVRFQMHEKEGPADAPRPLLLAGTGERLLIDHLDDARLEAAPGERVAVHGELPSHGAPFELTADLFLSHGGSVLQAVRPELTVTRLEEEEGLQPLVASALRLIASEESLDLIDEVHVRSTTPSGVPWRLRSGRVILEGSAGNAESETVLRAIHASGGVEFELGVRESSIDERSIARASGVALEARSLLGTLRLTGAPARIESPELISEAEWIEFDPDLQIVTATGPGRMLPTKELTRDGAQPRWSLEYLASSTLIIPESLVFVLQEPTFRDNEVKGTVRSSWTLCWVDRKRWMELPDVLASGQLAAEELRVTAEQLDARSAQRRPMASLFGKLETTAFAGLLREIYFEGPVEVQLEEDLLARADAIFLDVVDGHGWLANATIHVYGHLLGQRFDKWTVKANWLRHSRDGSLRADDATVAPCDYDKPHIRIVTGDLELVPAGDRSRVSMRDNRIELYDTLRLPLPPISFGLDERGRLDLPTFRFGDSARFGEFVSARVVRPAGKIGKAMNWAFWGNPFDYDANYSVHMSWLGSRGLLLDLGLDLESKQKYWVEMHLGGLPDGGQDRGYIRVPDRERDNLRLWYRGRSRHMIGEQHWIDTALSLQTDPGVQSEFFESEFEEFEARETFAHWRLASGDAYLDASVKVRTENFRAEINELPSAGVYRGRHAIAELGPLRFVHSGDLRAERLARREGEQGRQSPYALPPSFDDGEGNRELMRVDTSQRLELPLSTGSLGLKATPWVGARFTAWDEGVSAGQTPTRFLADAGFRLAGNFWKRGENGKIHQLSPYVEWSEDFAYEEHGDPLRFDSLDDPLEGRHLTLGTRARLNLSPDGPALLDLDVQARHTAGLGKTFATRPPDRDVGWSGAVFARLNVEAWDIPVQLWHDGRYAFDRDEAVETVYSITRAAFRLTEDLRFEGGHRRGLLSEVSRDLDPIDPGGPNAETSFEAASIGGIYSWTDKWEFEGRQVFSLRDNIDLSTDLVLRRFGHDIIFEIESSVRESEGASLHISVRPRYGWRPSRLGFLNF